MVRPFLIFLTGFALIVFANSIISDDPDKVTRSSTSSLNKKPSTTSSIQGAKSQSSSVQVLPTSTHLNSISTLQTPSATLKSHNDSNGNSPPPTTSIPVWEQVYADVDNPYYMTDWPFDRNASLRSSCGSVWSTYFYQWIATADRKTFDPPFQTSVHAEVSKGITLDYIYDTWTSTFILPDVTIQTLSLPASPGTTGHSDFTASPPCCRTCTFSVGDIEVYHWPTGTPPAIQTLTNTEGYTFIYPSVYISFQTIAARDLCGLVGTAAAKGITTIGFNQSELSTANSYWYNQTVQTTTPRWYPVYNYKNALWENDMTCTDITTSLYIAYDSENTVIESPLATFSTTTLTYTLPKLAYYTITVTWHPVKLPVTYNPCRPWLSVPQRIYTLQSEWSSCIQNIKGLRDPPNWLTTGSGFYPITSKTKVPAQPVTTNGASAAPAIAQPTPTKTPSPGVDPGSPPPTYDPPSPQQTSKLPAIVTFGGNTITVISTSALEATIAGTTIAVTTNSKSELVGTFGGTTVTFTTNSASALVGTVGGTTITAHSEPVLVGTFGGSTITFTTNSKSGLVGTIGGSTITAKPASTFGPGTQTHLPGLGGTYAGTGSKSRSSYGPIMLVFWVLIGCALRQDLIL